MPAMRRPFLIAPLLPLLTLGATVPDAPLELPEIDFIRVDKGARSMSLFADGKLVHVIEHIQLGDEPLGPKHFEGDERTPEGRYTIDWGNPDSSYHLSLHISYPEAADIAYARAKGRSPGGMIMIHGQPNFWPTGTRVPGDWTDGCIAVSDEEIEALWNAVPDGTPIEIRR